MNTNVKELSGDLIGKGLKIGIVVSRFNDFFTKELVGGSIDCLVRHGVTPFYVVRLDATRVLALSAVCTHVRCILGYDPARRTLICPCHDGRFNPATGVVVSGPPPAPLPPITVTVEGDQIYLTEA